MKAECLVGKRGGGNCGFMGQEQNLARIKGILFFNLSQNYMILKSHNDRGEWDTTG